MIDSLEVGWYEHIETGGEQWEQREGPSEAERSRVREWSKKAKQMAGFIAKKKKQNNKIANFLSYIIKNINNDKLYKYIYDLFFIQYGHGTRSSKIKNDIHSIILVGMFLPFFIEQWHEFGVIPPFKHLAAFETPRTFTLDEYLQYLKKLSNEYHDNTDVDKKKLIYLILEIIKEFDVSHHHTLPKEEYHAFVKQISLDLLGKAPRIG